MSRRSFKSIYLYIFKEVFVAFCIAFLFLFFIFFVNVILLMAERILSKQLPIWDVILILICNLPQVIALSIPFGALIGGLMAVGRLSSDNEILAFRSSGVSIFRIFVPVVFASVLFTFVSFMFNDYFLSLGFLEMSKIYRTLFSRNPALELEPYSAKIYDNKIIITGNIRDNIISDIIIIDKTSENEKRIITAKNAHIIENKNQEGVISLRLDEVFSHLTEQGKYGDYEYSKAEGMEYNILISKIIPSVAITPTAREMTSYDVYRAIAEKNRELADKRARQAERVRELYYRLATEMKYARESVDPAGRFPEIHEAAFLKTLNDIRSEKAVKIEDASLRTYVVEFNKKFSHPFSCVVFMLFAFPVGLFARKSGRFLGFMIGVIMSAFYWGMLFVSYRMGYQAELSPFLIIWFPNMVFFVLGSVLLFLRLRR